MSERQQGTEPRNVDVAEPQASSGDTSATAGYTVGYKRLPVHSRFKPGHSGDPKGRLPGSANAKTTVQRVMNEKVSVRRGQKTSTVSALSLADARDHTLASSRAPASCCRSASVLTIGGALLVFRRVLNAAQVQNGLDQGDVGGRRQPGASRTLVDRSVPRSSWYQSRTRCLAVQFGLAVERDLVSLAAGRRPSISTVAVMPAASTTPVGTSSMCTRTGMRCARRTHVKMGLTFATP
jgi:hypothetical protein